jgi:uncharacterized protein with von Willebrand factor type A (vWA) domain
MEVPLTRYVRALRLAGARVSAAESIDAMRTVALVGYADRALLKESLGAVLAKSLDEKALHDRLFDLHFKLESDPARAGETQADETAAGEPEAGEQEAGEPQAGGGVPGSGNGGGGDASESGAPSDDFTELADSGDEDRIALALAQAAAKVGADNIRFETQTGFFARRMLEELGVGALEKRMLDKFAERTPEAEAEAMRLIDLRREMLLRAREVVDQRFQLFGVSATENFMAEVVGSRALDVMGPGDMPRMKILVQKLAKRLADRHARRLQARNKGRLDIGRTLRASAGYGGVPFDVVWKQKKKDRPRIVAICDVSGSVARHVRFLLLLLYALNERVADLRTFAFSARLEDVEPILDELDFEQAMRLIVDRIGSGSTDYGQALVDLEEQHHGAIDRRTTVLIMGDGRSNNTNPRIDLFQSLSEQAKRVIWLTPERENRWGTGDSCLLDYRPWCTRMRHSTSVLDLEAALDDILSAYD